MTKEKKSSKPNSLLSLGLISVVALVFFIFTSSKSTDKKTDDQTTYESTSQSSTSEASDNLYEVLKIVDGDTIKVNINSVVTTVRLIGIDTPESVDPRKPVECFAKEASQKLEELLKDKKVKLESDPTQSDMDQYKRLLRYVILEDGTNINELMIKTGFAHEFTYDIDYRDQDKFIEAQTYAKINNLGLWNSANCPQN